MAGVPLAGLGVVSVVWGVVRAKDDGWTSAAVLGRLVLGAVLLISPGDRPLQAGLRTLPWTAAPMLVAPLAGLLAPRTGMRPLLTAGLALQAAGLAWIGLLVTGTTSYPGVVPGLVLAGVGMGLTFAPSATAVLADMAESEHGTASSVDATVRELATALGVAVIVAVFQTVGRTLTPGGYAGGLRPAMLVGAAVLAVAAGIALFMPAVTGRSTASAPAVRTPAGAAQPA